MSYPPPPERTEMHTVRAISAYNQTFIPDLACGRFGPRKARSAENPQLEVRFMRSRRLIRDMAGVALAVSLVGCGPEWVNTDGKDQDNSDIDDALARLGDATVLSRTIDGVPTHIVGDLAHVGDGQIEDLAQAEAAIRPALAPVLAPFRLTTDEVKLRKVNI